MPPTDKPEQKLTATQVLEEAKKASEDLKERQDHLKGYFDKSKEFESKMDDFRKNLDKWEGTDKVQMRMAGVAESENDPLKSKDGYLDRHVKLSSTFLTWDDKMKAQINFQGYKTAEHKVGLGDMLPPTVRAVNVFKDGVKIHALRARDPNTGRIGYFDAEMLKQNVYSYVPVFTGDAVEVAKTVKPGSPEAQRYTLMEHVAVYKDKAMEADAGMETLYTTKGDYVGQEEHVNPSTNARRQRQNIEREVAGQPQSPIEFSGQLVEIEGQKFPQLTRRHLEQYWGVKESQTSRLLAPVEFLGQRFMVNRYVIPFLMEAESRMKERGVHYKAHKEAGGCQCYNHRGIRRLDGSTSNVLSKHSWGIALDINPGEHPFGKRYNQLNPNKRMPIEFVRIMEECGFRWGNEFRNADPMHFEFAVYPPNARGILKNPDAIAFFDRVTKGNRMPKMASSPGQTRGPSPNQKSGSPEKVPGSSSGTIRSKFETNPKYRMTPDKMRAAIERATSRWQPLITEACQKYGITKFIPFVKAIIYQESGGKPDAVGKNRNGTYDRGLMQLNSAYFKHPNIMDPEVNIDLGVKNIARLVQRFKGNLIDVAASYNCGHPEGLPSKSQPGGRWGIPNLTKYTYVPNVIYMMKAQGVTDLPTSGTYSSTQYA